MLLIVLRISRFSPGPVLSRLSVWLGIITVTQIFLGMGSFIFTRMLHSGYAPSQPEVLFTAAHQSLGALVLMTTFLITLRVWR